MELTKTVLNLSARWFRLKEMLNKETLHEEEISLEVNRINETLIDTIINL